MSKINQHPDTAPVVYYFKGSSTPQSETLRAVGIRTSKPTGWVSYWRSEENGGLYAEVGYLFAYADGRINAVPYKGASPWMIDGLRGAALDVWRGVFKTSNATGWGFHRYKNGACWSTCISLPLSKDSGVAQEIARAHTVVRTEAGIELGINTATATVDFGDAEHIASLLIDLARIARFQGGISRAVVA